MTRFQRKALSIAAMMVFSFAVSKGAFTQDMKSDHWSTAELQERARHLKELAAEKGNASEKLEIYPHHFTMLAFRNRTGGGEVHQNYADVFYILDGRAT